MKESLIQTRGLSLAALVCGLVTLIAGCDTAASMPAEPPDAEPADSETRVTTIGLILPRKGYPEAEVWEQTFRLEATRAGILSDVVRSEPGEQWGALLKMIERHPEAVVLAPDPTDKKLAAAVSEVTAQGVPIVLLDRPIDGAASPVVRLEAFDDSARRLVAAAIDDAKKEKLPVSGPAVVMINGPFDDKGRERVAALHKALREAKVETLSDVVFEGFMQEAGQALEKALGAHPEITIVLADEAQGARAAGTVRDTLPSEKTRFVLAAFGDGPDVGRMAKFNQFAGLAERDLEKQSRTALVTAIAAARGDVPKSEILIPLRFSRAEGAPMRSSMQEARSRKPVDPELPPKESDTAPD